MAESLGGKHAASDEYRMSFQASRMSDSLSMACDYHYDPFCEVCFETRNRNIKHEGFCKDCVQFLCEDCLRVHRKLQAARGHMIQRGDDMPKSMADKPPKFDFCDVHQRSWKDQFCGTHKVLLCSLCVSLQHKDCPVESVDDACKGVSSSQIDALYNKVSGFKDNLLSVVSQFDLNVTELGKQKVDMLKDAQDLKDKSIAKIENLFQEITSEIKSTHKAHTSDLGRGQNNLNGVILNLKDTLDDIDKIKGSTIDTKVFLKIQDILKDVEQCKADCENLRPSVMKVKISFIPDKRMKEIVSTSYKIGSISLDTSQPQVAISIPDISFPMSPIPVPLSDIGKTPTGVSGQVAGKTMPLSQIKGQDLSTSLRPPRRGGKTPTGASGQVAGKTMPLSQIKAQKLASYNVKLDDDKSDCCITGMAITNDGRRLLADYGNSKIKMFSRDKMSLCSLSLSTRPEDIAVTGDREAVVSCHGETKLLILDISDRKMSIKGTVELPFPVYAIVPYQDKLLVTTLSAPSLYKLLVANLSTSPASVALIDQSGRVYWSADTDQQGQPRFSYPWHMTCYDDGGSAAVIVSDCGNDMLTVLNADTGDVITRRQVKGKSPKGVTTDTTGNIYVCYGKTCGVAVLTIDLSQENVLLSKRDGLSSRPQAIVYNAVDHQLLVSNVSNDSRNTVDCFKLQ